MNNPRLLPWLAALALLASVQAQRTVALWSFNDTNSISPAIGNGEYTLAGPVASQFFTGSDSDPAATGNYGLSLSAFPEQGSSAKSAGVQFAVSTVGYQNVRLTLDLRGSATAARNAVVQYSVNGADFIDAASLVITRDGSFIPGLTVDLTAVAAANNNPNFAFRIVSDFYDAAGYKAVRDGSTYSTSGTWRLDVVTVSAQPTGGGTLTPRILLHPESRSVLTGNAANFAVIADGALPLTYQWQHAGTNLPDATLASLLVTNVSTASAGEYRVVVGNALGGITSNPAILTVLEKQGAITTNIAYLHTLLDPVNFNPTDTTNRYTVEGIVTTHVSLTTDNNALFYIQDDTGGIPVYVSGGAKNAPPAGAKVRVTGPLSQYNGLLEFYLYANNPDHSWTLLSTGNALPQPIPFEFGWQNDPLVMEPIEGSYLVVSNVFLDLTSPTFGSGANVNMTNEYGEIFVLRIDARVDIVGQAKPTTPVTILGVLSQFDVNDPRASGYQLLPTRFADILSASKAPAIRFTNHLANLVRPGDLPANTFTDHALRPGESLTITIHAVDPEGRTLTLKPVTTGLPASAQWSFDALSGTTVTGQFSFQPTAADAGQLYPVTLAAWNTTATNTQVWNVYVPTPAEQHIVLTEYLANPTSDPAAPHFNPLGRTPVEEHLNPGQHDEYLEFANLSTEDVDLLGWSIADGVQVRHRFYDTLVLGAGGALVVYGGPLNGLLPSLDVPSIPASESSAGLALNNNGDTLTVRNAHGHVVLRVVYPESQVAPDGSYTRYPDANGTFLPHPCVSALPVSPGRQYDDRPWSEPPALGPGQVNNLRVALIASGTPRILWQAEPNRVYSVWKASRIDGPFTRIASCLASGEFDDAASADANRFYRVSTP